MCMSILIPREPGQNVNCLVIFQPFTHIVEVGTPHTTPIELLFLGEMYFLLPAVTKLGLHLLKMF